MAYAVRYKIDEIALLYPDTIQNYQNEATGFTIRDEFADQVDVNVTAWQLPVINRLLMDNDSVKRGRMYEVFEVTVNGLRQRLERIVKC